MKPYLIINKEEQKIFVFNDVDDQNASTENHDAETLKRMVAEDKAVELTMKQLMDMQKELLQLLQRNFN